MKNRKKSVKVDSCFIKVEGGWESVETAKQGDDPFGVARKHLLIGEESVHVIYLN